MNIEPSGAKAMSVGRLNGPPPWVTFFRNEENYVRSLLLNFIHRLRNRQASDRLARLISGLGSGPKPAPYPAA
jgi:hypothetical protein